jgi:hypothetical protein
MLFASISAAVLLAQATFALNVPTLNVPACPKKATITYNKTVPDLADFPKTQVDLCYDDSSIKITFIAYNETNFYYNTSLGNNQEIYNYEVMEAFIYQGTKDPQTYLEYEINPGNVTYSAFVYNPSKVRAPGAPFDHFYINNTHVDGFTAATTLDRYAKKWTSNVQIPLGIFNVDKGEARGTQWRMNFYRTVVGRQTFPNQLLGSWSPPTDAPSFHETPYFGRVTFV